MRFQAPRNILFLFISITQFAKSNCEFGINVDETVVVIDTLDDLAGNPGWGSSGCSYFVKSPGIMCRTNATVDPSDQTGFWAPCAQYGGVCGITYERQPGETLLKVQVIGHRKGVTHRSATLDIVVKGGATYGDFVHNDRATDLARFVIADSVEKLIIIVSSLQDSEGAYYLVDKIILHKIVAPRITSTDLEQDLSLHSWLNAYPETCLYKEKLTDFVCNGKPVTVEDPTYVGKGFWVGCSSCVFRYYRLPGETLRKLEIHGTNLKPGGLLFSLIVCSTRSWQRYNCLEFYYNVAPGTIDFADYFSDDTPVEFIELSSYDLQGNSYAMLDKLVLHKTYSGFNYQPNITAVKTMA
jgi:hypothetical protein